MGLEIHRLRPVCSSCECNSLSLGTYIGTDRSCRPNSLLMNGGGFMLLYFGPLSPQAGRLARHDATQKSCKRPQERDGGVGKRSDRRSTQSKSFQGVIPARRYCTAPSNASRAELQSGEKLFNS